MRKKGAVISLLTISFLLISYYFLVWGSFNQMIFILFIPLNLLILLSLFFWSKKNLKITLEKLDIKKKGILKSSFIGFLLGAIVAIPVIGYLLFFSTDLTVYGAPPIAGISLAALLFRLFIYVPIRTVIFEEVIFRGILYTGFQKYFSKIKAILFTSLAFAFLHIGPTLFSINNSYQLASSNVITFIGFFTTTFLGSIFFIIVREKTKNLAGSMTSHWIIDALPTVVVWSMA